MKLRQVSLQSRQTFVRLCLILFPEYRSIRLTKQGKVILWKKKFSLFNNHDTLNLKDLIFTHIPFRLSLNKWNSADLYYDSYFDTIKSMFEMYLVDYRLNIRTSITTKELDKYIDWFFNELNKSFIMDISNSLLPIYKVIISQEIEMKTDKKKLRVLKVNIKEDLVNPTLSRIKELNYTLSHASLKQMIASVILLVSLNLGVWFKNITTQILSLNENKPPDITHVPALQYYASNYLSLVTNPLMNQGSCIFKSTTFIESYSKKNYYDSS